MATPNLVNIATITPFTIAGAVTTSNVDIIDVATNKTRKINSIIISNVDGSNSATVSISVSVDNGSNYYPSNNFINKKFISCGCNFGSHR